MVQLTEQRDSHQRLIAGVAPVFFFQHSLPIIKKPLNEGLFFARYAPERRKTGENDG